MIHRWIREYGGPHVDLFATADLAEGVARDLVARGMPVARSQQEAARQVVSAALVLAVRRGDKGAADQLIAVWMAEVFRWCRFHRGRGLSVEDAAHDALVRMFDQLHRLRDPDRFRPWLWGVVWRVLKEHERRSWWSRWIPGTVRAGGDLEQEVHRAERIAKVAQVLAELSLEQRALLFLAYVEGCGRKEIARDLGIPEGTLNRKLTAAREAFAAEARAAGLDGATHLACAWEEA